MPPQDDLPVQALDMSESKRWPGSVVLLLKADYLAKLQHVLKAHKIYRRAQNKAELENCASQTLCDELQVQIARYERELRRLSANVPSSLNVDVSRVKAKLVPLKRLLETLKSRREESLAAVGKQAEELWVLQEKANYEFEKALLAEKMLEAVDLQLPLPVKESDVFVEYKALCAQHSKALGKSGRAGFFGW